MKAGFDTSFLTLVVNPKAYASVKEAAELVDDLIQDLEKRKAKIIVPAPVLAELLLKASKSGRLIIETLKSFSSFQIKPFDEKSAVEMVETIFASIGNKRGKKKVSKMKVSFDRQIVAIAKAHGATEMYSDDRQVREFAKECGMEAFGFSDLKLSPKQRKLPYDKAEEQAVTSSIEVQRSGRGPIKGQGRAGAKNSAQDETEA